MGIYDDNYDFGNDSQFSEDQLNNPGQNIDGGGYNYEQGSFQMPSQQQNSPEYTSDMFQNGINNFGQDQNGLQATTGLNSVGEYGNQGNLTQATQMPSGGVSSFLQQLFQGNQGKALTTGLGALMSGYTNKKKAQQLQQLASTLRQSGDPFGSQRPFYQQQLQSAVQDPYSAPIVRNQVDALQQAQAIKDAAAGRRSNSMTSSPALLAAQAQVAQNYINSMMQPAGANISPNMSNYMQAQTGAINAGTNGYMSPLASAVGYNQQSNSNQSAMAEAIQKFLAGSQ